MTKFFIRDCNGAIVGNHKGYATMRGATRQQNNPHGKAYAAIWAAFDKQSSKLPGWSHVSSIKGV